MKKTILTLSSISMLTLMSLAAQAADEMAMPTAEPMTKSTMEQSCMAIETACKSAGFVVGGAKNGKGLIENCVKPVLSGTKVEGVTVQDSDVAACQAHHKMSGKE